MAPVGVLKSDQLIILFEQKILSGELTPGTVLPTEPELCSALGVSRTVLRDAMRGLVARGLLTVRQGHGTVITEPSGDVFAASMAALLARSNLETREVMASRELLETFVAGIAAESGIEEDWHRLRLAYDKLDRSVKDNDPIGASEAHADFHTGIIEATHHPALVLLLAPMSKVATLTGVASVRRGSMGDWEVECHLPIINALERGDADAARHAMHEHFVQSTRPSAYSKFLAQPFYQVYLNQDPLLLYPGHKGPPRDL